MMDHSSFVRQICFAPNEDGPRLAYADFLEEQGESLRAEFIRVQIENFCIDSQRIASGKSGFRTKKIRDRFSFLKGREVAILSNSKSFDWFPTPWWSSMLREVSDSGQISIIPVTDWKREPVVGAMARVPSPIMRYRFRRGFVEELELEWDVCRDFLHALIRKNPILEVRVRF